MARPGPQTHAKRQREQTKKDKRRAKDEKKALRKAQKSPDFVGESDELEGSDAPVAPVAPETVE